MLSCEGYKMFEGTMMIFPKSDEIQPYSVTGTWLYKPDVKCWYCKGFSYPEEVCQVLSDKTVIVETDVVTSKLQSTPVPNYDPGEDIIGSKNCILCGKTIYIKRRGGQGSICSDCLETWNKIKDGNKE